MNELFRTFWHGGALSPYENLCLVSFLFHGYAIELYSYDRNLVVPDGVTLIDAARILPESRLTTYKRGKGKGSASLFSNFFRYTLLRDQGGWWTDADIVCLRRWDKPADRMFFALQDKKFVNTALMRFPPGHPVMADCAHIAGQQMDNAVWGQLGPKLFTKMLKRHGLFEQAESKDAAYPVGFKDWTDYFDQSRRTMIEEQTTESYFIHFWHEMLRRSGADKNLRPPAGSFLDLLFERFGVCFPSSGRLSLEMLNGL